MAVQAASRAQSGATSLEGETEKVGVDNSRVRVVSPRVIAMALVVSIGGLIFGTASCIGQCGGLTDRALDFRIRHRPDLWILGDV